MFLCILASQKTQKEINYEHWRKYLQTQNTKKSLTLDVLNAKNFSIDEQYRSKFEMIWTQMLKKKKFILFLSHLTHFSSLSVPCIFHSASHSLTLSLSSSNSYTHRLTMQLACHLGPLATLPYLQLTKPNLCCRISLSLLISKLWVCWGVFCFVFLGWVLRSECGGLVVVCGDGFFGLLFCVILVVIC